MPEPVKKRIVTITPNTHFNTTKLDLSCGHNRVVKDQEIVAHMWKVGSLVDCKVCTEQGEVPDKK